VIGIKVWVFKGEVISKHEQQLAAPAAVPEAAPAPDATAPRAAPKKRRAGVKHAAAS
jgi:ribosomal protein S3